MSSDKHLRCSFCGKSKETVKKFISGPSVYICNECISLCNEILAEEEDREASESAIPSPTPREIKDVLDQYVTSGSGISSSRAKTVCAIGRAENRRRGLPISPPMVSTPRSCFRTRD